MNINGYEIKPGADLKDANLSYADLSYADLRGADLKGANLYCANLEGANLWNAALEYADLKGANLEGAYLKGAYLSFADITNTILEEKDNDKDLRIRVKELEEELKNIKATLKGLMNTFIKDAVLS